MRVLYSFYGEIDAKQCEELPANMIEDVNHPEKDCALTDSDGKCYVAKCSSQCAYR